MRDASFGHTLRRRRVELGWTQQELAHRSGLSVRTVRDIERDRGDAVRTTSGERLARLLDIDRPTGRPLEIGVLGPLRVVRDGRAVELGGVKQRCVLALLAMQVGSTVSRDEIAEVLWGAAVPGTWQSLVHTYLARVRKTMDPSRRTSRITARPTGYQLELDSDQIDVLRFAGLVERGELAGALDCWRGRVRRCGW